MQGYNIVIPSSSRQYAPEIILPVMDALQSLDHTPVVLDMNAMVNMYRQMRYERHGCYEIFQFYLRDLIKKQKIDFGYSVGLWGIMEDRDKHEGHQLIEECGIPNVILLHAKSNSIIEQLNSFDALKWNCTYFACTSKQLEQAMLEAGYERSFYSPLGSSQRLFYPEDNAPDNAAYPIRSKEEWLTKDYEVSFVGSYTPGRAEYLGRLSRAGVSIAIWGDKGWMQDKELASSYRNHAQYLHHLNTIYNSSKINLDLPDETTQYSDYVSTRVFDVLSAQGFLLTYRREELSSVADENREVACFDDIDNLLSTIEFYAEQPAERHAIAVRGFRRITAEAPWRKRLEQMLPRLEMHLLHSVPR